MAPATSSPVIFLRVRLIRSSKRKYCGDARNTGLAQARGRVIALIDADCTAPKNWAREILQSHETNAALAIGGTIANCEPASLVAWAAYFSEFSSWMPGKLRKAPGQILPARICLISAKLKAVSDLHPRNSLFRHRIPLAHCRRRSVAAFLSGNPGVPSEHRIHESFSSPRIPSRPVFCLGTRCGTTIHASPPHLLWSFLRMDCRETITADYITQYPKPDLSKVFSCFPALDSAGSNRLVSGGSLRISGPASTNQGQRSGAGALNPDCGVEPYNAIKTWAPFYDQ